MITRNMTAETLTRLLSDLYAEHNLKLSTILRSARKEKGDAQA